MKTKYVHNAFCRRWMLVLLVCCVTTVLPGEVPVSEKILHQLQSAGHARRTLLKEREEWAAEKQRLELLVSTVQQRSARYRKKTEENQKRIAEYGKKDRELADLRDRHQAVSEVIDQMAAWLKKQLDEMDTESIPGLVAPATEKADDPAGRLSSGVIRLTRSIERGRDSAIELVSGFIGEKEITVNLVRAGGVAAWWVSLDWNKAGVARVEDGRLILEPAAGFVEAGEIKKALEILKKRRSPELLILPAASGDKK